MNTPLFIAKRLLRKESAGRALSKPIVRIATIGIALGMAVMILAIGIVTGFQKEIREKVIGFGSHIQITAFGDSRKFSDPKLEIKQDFYPHIDTVTGVKSINLFALKEGVIETPENIQGILAKGVYSDYDWSFLESNLVAGRVLSFSDTVEAKELMLSKYLAGRLQLELGDRIPIYFQNRNESLSQRNFTIVGLFDTGLKEMDEEFVFVHIDEIRALNQWGISAQMRFEDCLENKVILSAKGFGGEGDLRWKWNTDSLTGSGPHEFCLLGDTLIYAIATDRAQTIPDTAFFRFRGDGRTGECQCPEDGDYEIYTSGGSAKYYTGGFEVQLNSYEELDRMDEIIYAYLNYDLKTSTIKQHLPEIFNWLEMLDLNTIVIIGLMILISIINMTSALLILIMERTNMIGMLKALGANTWFIQRIFLVQAGYIISIGLVAGNILGIGLAFLQKQFGFLTLDPENYYVSVVPVLLDPITIIVLNIATLAVCLAALLLPSLAVAQIRPSKAIRFD